MKFTKQGKKALHEFYSTTNAAYITLSTALIEAHRKAVQPKAGRASHYKNWIHTKGVTQFFGFKDYASLSSVRLKVGNTKKDLWAASIDFNPKTMARYIQKQL